MPSQSRITPDRAVLTGVLLAAIIYCRDLRYDFILDDLPLILLNDTLTSWRNWKTAFTANIFGSSYGFNLTAIHYRPVYVLWLMLNQQLFGSVAPWWHLTSFLLHVGVTLLVYRLGVVLLKDRWTAALAALLFLFHPIHVEPVGYVSASSDLLAALFLLIAFLAYSQFREPAASRIYLVASVIAAALAILSKESAAVFPLLLVAYEALRASPGARQRWKQFAWTLPFFAVVAAYALVRTSLFGRNLGPGPGGNRVAALVDAPLVLIVYLRNLLWSFRLSFFYPTEWTLQWTYAKACAVGLVILLAVFLWNRYRDQPGVRLQLLWTGILLAIPVSAVATFVKEDWVHDRHMYLVSIPFWLIVAALLRDPKIPARACMVASSLILVTLLFETAVQLPRFSNELTIYESTIKVAPGNALARLYYASALLNYGHPEEAFGQFRVAAELVPKSPVPYQEYAAALAANGLDQEAAAQYTMALQRTPNPTQFRASVLYGLAVIELKNSEAEEGASHLREALAIDPQAPNYHAALARALRQQGRTQEADEQMRLEAAIEQRFPAKHPPVRD